MRPPWTTTFALVACVRGLVCCVRVGAADGWCVCARADGIAADDLACARVDDTADGLMPSTRRGTCLLHPRHVADGFVVPSSSVRGAFNPSASMRRCERQWNPYGWAAATALPQALHSVRGTFNPSASMRRCERQWNPYGWAAATVLPQALHSFDNVLVHTHVQAPLCRLVPLRLWSVSTGPIGLVLEALSKE
jgi:hypothetical protein